MRVLVCGGRDFKDKAKIRAAIEAVDPRPTVIIHGAAKGADSLAGEVAVELGIPVEPFPADWAKYGRSAGSIRNKEMLDVGKPDMVLAFPTPSSKGTWDMVRRSNAAKVPTKVF